MICNNFGIFNKCVHLQYYNLLCVLNISIIYFFILEHSKEVIPIIGPGNISTAFMCKNVCFRISNWLILSIAIEMLSNLVKFYYLFCTSYCAYVAFYFNLSLRKKKYVRLHVLFFQVTFINSLRVMLLLKMKNSLCNSHNMWLRVQSSW